MKSRTGTILPIGFITAAVMICGSSVGAAAELYATIGNIVRPPIGWVEFCTEHPLECKIPATKPRDVTMTAQAWNDLAFINTWINRTIKPMTDFDHYGVVDKWTYPNDGYGDCEDYVLLKRRMLIEAGWPREALLITVVIDRNGDGHAVLTVKSDRGEFVLDNQVNDIALWSRTGYRFVKRQSQTHPNVWISLGDSPPAPATASSR